MQWFAFKVVNIKDAVACPAKRKKLTRKTKKTLLNTTFKSVFFMPESYEPLTIFILAPGAFFVLAGLVALQNKVKNNMAKKGKKVPETVGCGEGCASCGNASSCSGKIFPTGEEDAKNE